MPPSPVFIPLDGIGSNDRTLAHHPTKRGEVGFDGFNH